MRITINISDEILYKAKELTGVQETTSLVNMGLKALITQESHRRLTELGGSQKSLRPIPRRRF